MLPSPCGHSRSRGLEIFASRPAPLAMGCGQPWGQPSGVDLYYTYAERKSSAPIDESPLPRRGPICLERVLL